jgi:hypothetical protein
MYSERRLLTKALLVLDVGAAVVFFEGQTTRGRAQGLSWWEIWYTNDISDCQICFVGILRGKVGGKEPAKRQGELRMSWKRMITVLAHFDMLSNSAAANPASKENRILPLSAALAPCASKLPVLRFFGIDNSDGLEEPPVMPPSVDFRW